MKKEEFSVEDYFSHIREAMAKIDRYMAGIDNLEDFLANSMLGDAVVRNIEIIGEASRNIQVVHPEFTKQHPEIANTLIDAYNMRNVVIHGYIEVDYAIVYGTAKYSLPEFKKQIESLNIQGNVAVLSPNK
jgi:uncharacterized protein with HEPN domain